MNGPCLELGIGTVAPPESPKGLISLNSAMKVLNGPWFILAISQPPWGKGIICLLEEPAAQEGKVRKRAGHRTVSLPCDCCGEFTTSCVRKGPRQHEYVRGGASKMPQRIGGEGVAGRVLLGGKMLGIACFKKKKCTNSYSSFKTPLKFPLPWEAFLISKGSHPVLPESSPTAPNPIALRWMAKEGLKEVTFEQM